MLRNFVPFSLIGLGLLASSSYAVTLDCDTYKPLALSLYTAGSSSPTPRAGADVILADEGGQRCLLRVKDRRSDTSLATYVFAKEEAERDMSVRQLAIWGRLGGDWSTSRRFHFSSTVTPLANAQHSYRVSLKDFRFNRDEGEVIVVFADTP